MNKLSNKRIVSSLIIMAILALGITVIPAKTNAQYAIYGYGYDTPYSSYGSRNVTTNVAPAPVVAKATPVVYSSTSNKVAVAKKTVKKASAAPVDNSLTANAGASGFMPTGIIQWLLLAILILIVVILARKVFGAEKKYHSTPMKHA